MRPDRTTLYGFFLVVLLIISVVFCYSLPMYFEHRAKVFFMSDQCREMRDLLTRDREARNDAVRRRTEAEITAERLGLR